MMGIFWAGAVIIVGYQANYLMFPSGVQDRITARSIISTMVLSALAILFIPFLVGIYSDIAMLFVALFANLVDPEIVVQGLLNYTIDDKLTEAMLKLIALAQHGMIFFLLHAEDCHHGVIGAVPDHCHAAKLSVQTSSVWFVESGNADQPVHAAGSCLAVLFCLQSHAGCT
ncbi:hypothetical protein [Brevibacillus thermoruber]|uniref:hypothetical protein n=1 Tax=Brevibacillus thermoruber TaxID=33942 RepID=UPI000556FECE|nr:hypothetical protein [Brevibacillus thermoruber]